MKKSQLEKYIKEAIKEVLSSSQEAAGVRTSDIGTSTGDASQLEEDNKEIVQYNGKDHTIEGGGADRYKINSKSRSPRSTNLGISLNNL